MFEGLGIFYRSLVSGTFEVWCVSCKGKRKVVKMGYSTITTKSGPKNRLQGKCKTCRSKTSTFVAIA